MKIDARLLAAALLFAPALSFGDPLAQRGLEEAVKVGPDLTDGMIEEKKRALDRVLARRNEEGAREAAEAIALENRLKQERSDFERAQIAERKAFLDGLKKEADAKKRSIEYGKFNTSQKNARRKFFNRQNGKREDLAQGYRKARMAEHESIAARMPAGAGKAPAKAKKGAKKG